MDDQQDKHTKKTKNKRNQGFDALFHVKMQFQREITVKITKKC